MAAGLPLRKALNIVLEKLIAVDKNAEIFRRDRFYKQLQYGCELCAAIYDLGVVTVKQSIQLNSAVEEEDKKTLNELRKLIDKNSAWLETFFAIFAIKRVGIGSGYPAEHICKTRSGIQFLVDLFANSGDEEFDFMLNELRESLVMLDEHLKSWDEEENDIGRDPIPAGIPKSHWWWYTNTIQD